MPGQNKGRALSENESRLVTQEGEIVQLVGLSHKSFIIVLKSGETFHTHRGIISHDDVIGKEWGTQISSHNGSPFFILQPSLTDLLRNTKRATQIMYPKEIGYILLYMGIGPGSKVIEAGTGSGSFTTALAHCVGDIGRVYSYELKEETQASAQRTLKKLGLSENVVFKIRDISDGFDEKNVDAVFLDVSNPYDYLAQVRRSLKSGGHFGCLLPTTNQVIQLLVALRRHDFAFVEVCDVSVRFYKPEPTRFRPTDRMISHTGYLIFARPVLLRSEEVDGKLLREIGLVGIDVESTESNEDDSES